MCHELLCFKSSARSRARKWAIIPVFIFDMYRFGAAENEMDERKMSRRGRDDLPETTSRAVEPNLQA
jgi:hypothetical protein